MPSLLVYAYLSLSLSLSLFVSLTPERTVVITLTFEQVCFGVLNRAVLIVKSAERDKPIMEQFNLAYTV